MPLSLPASIVIERTHPTCAPLKLRARLAQRQAKLGWPAAGTMGALFARGPQRQAAVSRIAPATRTCTRSASPGR